MTNNSQVTQVQVNKKSGQASLSMKVGSHQTNVSTTVSDAEQMVETLDNAGVGASIETVGDVTTYVF